MIRLVARLVLLTVLLTSTAAFADWPQWRGPERDGRSPGEDFPANLETLQPTWSAELGKGYPGPIIAEDRVFVVETLKDESVQVRALKRASGEPLWSRAWPSSGKVPFFAAENGDWVRATPAYDGKRLFVGDMQEVLVALDAASGEVLWKVDFPETFGTPVPDFGFASSPMLHDGALIVQAADSVVSLDAESGKVRWRSLAAETDMMSRGAFSSPYIAEIGGKTLLLIQGRQQLHGLDPESGKVRWSHTVPSFRGMNILTPVVHGDGVFTSSYRQKSFFYEVGSDAVREAWTLPAAAYMSSPVVVDGHAYMHLGNGRLACIDLESGKETWRSSETFGKYVSMVVRGKQLLALTSKGELLLLEADPAELKLVARREVSGEETWGHLAVDGDEVFVRELEGIRAFRFERD